MKTLCWSVGVGVLVATAAAWAADEPRTRGDAGAVRPAAGGEVRAPRPAGDAGAVRAGGGEARVPRPAGDAGAPRERGGDAGAPRERGGGDALARGEFGFLTADLNLTEEQKTAIRALIEAARKSTVDWEQQNMDAIKRLQGEMKAASEAKDEAKGRQVREEMGKLGETRRQIDDKLRRDILAALTPEQQQMVGVLQLYSRQFAGMAKDLKLTPEDETKLKDQVKPVALKIVDWDKANGAKVTELEAQRLAIQVQLTALTADRQKMLQEYNAAGLAGLTPEQRTALISARLQQAVGGRYRQLPDLDPEQQKKIDALIADAAKTVTTIPVDQGGRQGWGPVGEKLVQDIETQVLTAGQRDFLKHPLPGAARGR